MDPWIYDERYLHLITATTAKNKDRPGYYVRYRLKDSSGKCIKDSNKRGFETQRAAKEYIEKLRMEHAMAMFKKDHPATMMTFAELYEQFRMSRLSNKLSTQIRTESIAQSRILPFFADKLVSEITLNTITQWHSCFYEEDGTPIFSSTYLRILHAQLSAILNYAVKCGWITQNPASSCSIGAKNADERPVWSVQEYALFRKQLQDDPEALCAFDTLYFTGVRRGELLALTVGDIDFEKNTISITKSLSRLRGIDYITSPKTKRSVRKFRISQTLADELKSFILEHREHEMSTRLICLNTGKLAAILKQGAKDAGLPYISIHCFRHSHITNLIAEGYSPVDIAKRVGHESIYITLHYSHAFKDVEGDIAQSLDREMNKAMEAEKPDAETR